jgi:hypothetical protein
MPFFQSLAWNRVTLLPGVNMNMQMEYTVCNIHIVHINKVHATLWEWSLVRCGASPTTPTLVERYALSLAHYSTGKHTHGHRESVHVRVGKVPGFQNHQPRAIYL